MHKAFNFSSYKSYNVGENCLQSVISHCFMNKNELETTETMRLSGAIFSNDKSVNCFKQT